MNLHVLPALLVLGGLSSCTQQRAAETLPVDQAGPCASVPATSLDAVYPEYLAAQAPTGCATSACHGGADAGSLQFVTAEDFWRATVNRTSTSTQHAGQVYVVPGAPEQSVAFTRLLPDAHNRMPQDGPYLDEAGLRAVAGWICAGAPAPSPDAGVDAGPTGPALTTVTPASVPVGAGAVQLQLDGARFEPTSRVELSGGVLPSTSVSATRLSATVGEAATAAAAEYRVRVVNPPDGGVSAERVFTVTNPAPSLAALAPDTVSSGGAPFDALLTGTGFVPTSVALLDGAPVATVWRSPTQLSARMPTFATPGPHTLAVRSPAPGGGTSAALTLRAVASNLPSITGLAPAPAPADTAFRLAVTGAGYTCTPTRASVLLDGAALAAATCTAQQLEVDVPARAAGSASVQVRNPNGDTSNTVALTLAAPNPVPVLSALAPAEAVRGSTALTVSAMGADFVAGATLLFNGSPRTTSLQGAGALSATLPASDFADGGVYPVTVVNPGPGGGASNALSFTVVRPNPLPAVTALAPCGLVAGAGGFTLTLTGVDFAPGASVTFGGTAVGVTQASATELRVSVPAGLVASAPADGAVPVVVTNPAPGGGASAPFTFGLASRRVTLAEHVQPVFTRDCATSGCHASPATPVNLTQGKAYAELVNQPSQDCTGRVLVRGCQPLRAHSVLIDKVLATRTSPACSGAPMPKSAPLSAADQKLLIDWVAQGAPP